MVLNIKRVLLITDSLMQDILQNDACHGQMARFQTAGIARHSNYMKSEVIFLKISHVCVSCYSEICHCQFWLVKIRNFGQCCRFLVFPSKIEKVPCLSGETSLGLRKLEVPSSVQGFQSFLVSLSQNQKQLHLQGTTSSLTMEKLDVSDVFKVAKMFLFLVGATRGPAISAGSEPMDFRIGEFQTHRGRPTCGSRKTSAHDLNLAPVAIRGSRRPRFTEFNTHKGSVLGTPSDRGSSVVLPVKHGTVQFCLGITIHRIVVLLVRSSKN